MDADESARDTSVVVWYDEDASSSIREICRVRETFERSESRRVGSWETWMLRSVPSAVRVGLVFGEEMMRPLGLGGCKERSLVSHGRL